ncbi:MAG: M4 family metallopeptidase [Myxococcaceae bacterium]|nr:M4 family metallopeptidase [Myxococcaceae bacterium]
MTIRRIGRTVVAPPQVRVPARATASKKTKSNAIRNASVARSVFEAVRRPSLVLGAPPPPAAPSIGDPAVTVTRQALVAPGPLALGSAEAQAAIARSLAFIQQQGARTLAAGGADTSPASFAPRSVEVDALGMAHVRLDRVHEGVKVFGEQVISHLDANGQVTGLTGSLEPIPAGLGSMPLAISEAEAKEIALRAFGDSLDKPLVLEKVIYRCDDGTWKVGYRAECENLLGGKEPRRVNFLICGQSGHIDDQWNQIGGVRVPKELQRATEPVSVTRTVTPNLPIRDLSTVESTLEFDRDVKIDQLAVGLEIPHTWKGDLRISLTSPSGKTVVVHDRTGGSEDDVIGTFPLEGFAGESAKGTWTLTVEDLARGDVGTLKSWALEVRGTEGGDVPPPPSPPGPAEGNDTTLYSGKVEIGGTKRTDGTWELTDTTRGKGIVVLDALGADEPSSRSRPITDDDGAWGSAGDPRNQRSAIDAMYGAQMTYDFYKDVLQRDSIDGHGEQLKNHIHVGHNYANAFWDGTQMAYGDGDGDSAGPMTTLDIAGHEITHGVTERTAGLLYRGESGGINESMSDIMGTMVEWYAAQKNGQVKFDWSIGEDCWTPNDGDPTDALRYMDDPTRDNYSIDNYRDYRKQTEVHGSSGIMNNAFYLLAVGGTNRTSGITVEGGIGPEDAAKIYGRALMYYMTPSTTFAQAREATVKAAIDLFGEDSVQVQKVKESWTAVGVE